MPASRTVPPRHPGKVLRERLEAHDIDIKQDKLADALGVARLSVNQMLNGRRGISPEMALRLEAVLGTSPRMWLQLQSEYDLFEAREKLGDKLHALPNLLGLPETAPT